MFIIFIYFREKSLLMLEKLEKELSTVEENQRKLSEETKTSNEGNTKTTTSENITEVTTQTKTEDDRQKEISNESSSEETQDISKSKMHKTLISKIDGLKKLLENVNSTSDTIITESELQNLFSDISTLKENISGKQKLNTEKIDLFEEKEGRDINTNTEKILSELALLKKKILDEEEESKRQKTIIENISQKTTSGNKIENDLEEIKNRLKAIETHSKLFDEESKLHSTEDEKSNTPSNVPQNSTIPDKNLKKHKKQNLDDIFEKLEKLKKRLMKTKIGNEKTTDEKAESKTGSNNLSTEDIQNQTNSTEIPVTNVPAKIVTNDNKNITNDAESRILTLDRFLNNNQFSKQLPDDTSNMFPNQGNQNSNQPIEQNQNLNQVTNQFPSAVTNQNQYVNPNQVNQLPYQPYSQGQINQYPPNQNQYPNQYPAQITDQYPSQPISNQYYDQINQYSSQAIPNNDANQYTQTYPNSVQPVIPSDYTNKYPASPIPNNSHKIVYQIPMCQATNINEPNQKNYYNDYNKNYAAKEEIYSQPKKEENYESHALVYGKEYNTKGTEISYQLTPQNTPYVPNYSYNEEPEPLNYKPNVNQESSKYYQQTNQGVEQYQNSNLPQEKYTYENANKFYGNTFPQYGVPEQQQQPINTHTTGVSYGYPYYQPMWNKKFDETKPNYNYDQYHQPTYEQQYVNKYENTFKTPEYGQKNGYSRKKRSTEESDWVESATNILNNMKETLNALESDDKQLGKAV